MYKVLKWVLCYERFQYIAYRNRAYGLWGKLEALTNAQKKNQKGEKFGL
jgi:hypothetical protein